VKQNKVIENDKDTVSERELGRIAPRSDKISMWISVARLFQIKGKSSAKFVGQTCTLCN
jgi:hypothetical protein